MILHEYLSGGAFCTLLVFGCASAESHTAAEVSTTVAPCTNRPIETDNPSLRNLLHITDAIYCGGEPRTEEAFASLANLGVNTVISVDGAQPDVAAGAFDRKEAFKILERAGTSKNYAGLWRAVENYRVPAADAELPELVEVSEVGSFTVGMAEIGRDHNNLKLCLDADWTTPANHPDLVPHQRALLLKEGCREFGRNLTDGFDQEFKTWLAVAETIAQTVPNALVVNDTDRAAQSFRALSQSCARCHEKYNNGT